MRKFRGIVESKTAPQDKEVVWYNGENLYIYNNGEWAILNSGSTPTTIVKTIIKESTTSSEDNASSDDSSVDNSTTENVSNGTTNSVDLGRITLRVIKDELHIYGYEKYVEAGYIPWLFRKIHRSDNRRSPNREKSRGYYGYGNFQCLKIEDGIVKCNLGNGVGSQVNQYWSEAHAFLGQESDIFYLNEGENIYQPWGRHKYLLKETDDYNGYRSHRFPFAIAFIKNSHDYNLYEIEPNDIVSNMATFKVYSTKSGNRVFLSFNI